MNNSRYNEPNIEPMVEAAPHFGGKNSTEFGMEHNKDLNDISQIPHE
jgi:hypothetical protein